MTFKEKHLLTINHMIAHLCTFTCLLVFCWS